MDPTTKELMPGF